jgi:sugar phosphate isomerase/epimerase
MQLGYSAWAMPTMPVAEQIALVRELGYVGIELVSGPSNSLDAVTITGSERQAIRRLLDEASLALPSIAGHADLLAADPETRAANLARLHAGIDLAADLAGPGGPPCLVTMAFGRPDDYERIRDTVADNFGELAHYAARRGVVVALEPHVGQAFDRPDRVRWLLDRVGSPNFKLNFDNSHFEVMGYDLAIYVPLLTKDAVHTHVKDQRGHNAEDFAFLVPGEGEFDYPRFLTALDRAGYAGFITIEISVMVQRRPGYDPKETARASFQTLVKAATQAAVALEHR